MTMDYSMEGKNIGYRIKKLREEMGISQEELAHKIGYKSKVSISKIEGNARNITQSRIKTIADALQTTPDYIMGWDKGDILAETKRNLDKMDADELRVIRKYAEYLQEDMLRIEGKKESEV